MAHSIKLCSQIACTGEIRAPHRGAYICCCASYHLLHKAHEHDTAGFIYVIIMVVSCLKSYLSMANHILALGKISVILHFK